MAAEGGVERIEAAYGTSYQRLVDLKNKYDSTNLFRHNQNIKPNCREKLVDQRHH
jgi:hypothetical protein